MQGGVLESVATRLEPLLGEVTFVGGQVVPLLLTAPASTTPRPTFDVDLVVSAASRSEMRKLEERLVGMGLRHDMRPGAPICRWRTPEDISVDVMAVAGTVLRFTNRWYAAIVEQAVEYPLSPSISIRIPPAPLYIAAKWEAFVNRGAQDPLVSADLEDVISVVAGRPEIVDEVAEAPLELREWLAREFGRFIEPDVADYAIQSVLGNTRLIPGIIPTVRTRFERMAVLP